MKKGAGGGGGEGSPFKSYAKKKRPKNGKD